MKQEISLFRNLGLATPSSVTFSESLNALVGGGYTSIAGNTYFNTLRLADGIFIKEDIGMGYWYTFLNGVHIYDLHTKTLLCERHFYRHRYSRETAKQDAENMLFELLSEAASKEKVIIDKCELLAKVKEIVKRAFFCDQMQEIQKTIKQLGV